MRELGTRMERAESDAADDTAVRDATRLLEAVRADPALPPVHATPFGAIRAMVDIALKALSPAVNDPSRAVQALDQIEAILRGEIIQGAAAHPGRCGPISA